MRMEQQLVKGWIVTADDSSSCEGSDEVMPASTGKRENIPKNNKKYFYNPIIVILKGKIPRRYQTYANLMSNKMRTTQRKRDCHAFEFVIQNTELPPSNLRKHFIIEIAGTRVCITKLNQRMKTTKTNPTTVVH